MPSLYVTDLDGTLIRDDLTLSPFSRARLTELLNDGAAITIATARSIVSLTAILGDLPFRLPIVEFNGSYLSDYHTRRHLVVNAIEPDVATETYRRVRAAGMRPFISAFDGANDLLFYREISNPGENAYLRERQSFSDRRLRQVPDLEPCLSHKVICLTMIDREERVRAVQDDLQGVVGNRLVYTIYAYRYFSGWHFFTVHDAKATKDQGIRALQEGWGFQGWPLVVFGDDVNDMPMFRIASRAVAVRNAIPEVKALAHEVIGTNEEDSVLRWISADHAKGRG